MESREGHTDHTAEESEEGHRPHGKAKRGRPKIIQQRKVGKATEDTAKDSGDRRSQAGWRLWHKVRGAANDEDTWRKCVEALCAMKWIGEGEDHSTCTICVSNDSYRPRYPCHMCKQWLLQTTLPVLYAYAVTHTDHTTCIVYVTNDSYRPCYLYHMYKQCLLQSTLPVWYE